MTGHLPGQNKVRPTLVLDLDETLVFPVAIRPARDHIPIRIGRRRIFVLCRPGLPQFLSSVSALFDICFFTASTEEYANQIIDAIAPETPPERRFFRESCATLGGYPVKDLRALKCPLDRVLLVDDIEGSALIQPRNLIRTSPWHGTDQGDSVLLMQLLPLLASVAGKANLPAAARKRLQKTEAINLFMVRIPEEMAEGEVP
jgi:Dullard-like phosphatase family protein